VNAIIEGVEIFYPKRLIERGEWDFFCPRSTAATISRLLSRWLENNTGSSHFFRLEQTRHAPVEGEALAIAWSLSKHAILHKAATTYSSLHITSH